MKPELQTHRIMLRISGDGVKAVFRNNECRQGWFALRMYESIGKLLHDIAMVEKNLGKPVDSLALQISRFRYAREDFDCDQECEHHIALIFDLEEPGDMLVLHDVDDQDLFAAAMVCFEKFVDTPEKRRQFCGLKVN